MHCCIIIYLLCDKKTFTSCMSSMFHAFGKVHGIRWMKLTFLLPGTNLPHCILDIPHGSKRGFLAVCPKISQISPTYPNCQKRSVESNGETHKTHQLRPSLKAMDQWRRKFVAHGCFNGKLQQSRITKLAFPVLSIYHDM